MRIYIRTDKGKRIRIPIPTWLIRMGTRFPIERIARKHISERETKCLEVIDWKEMRSLINSLSEYKGLKLVDIKANDGTEVLIQI
jgi:hypothetical protein